MYYKKILFYAIFLSFVNCVYSFSNYTEQTKYAPILGFIKKLDKPEAGVNYTIVLDKTIFGKEINTFEGLVKFGSVNNFV